MATPQKPVDGARLMEKTWENIQRKTFTGWVNSHLKKRGKTIKDLEHELGDGLVLIDLLEIIAGEDFPHKYEKIPKLRIQKVGNVGHALKFVETKGVKLAGIGPEEIVDQNLKMCLGLIWTIILRFQIQDISMEELSAKEALLLWCQRKTEGYKDVKVQNFHTSFQDGLAFCALIHKHRPDLLDFNALNKDNKVHNLQLAFDVAEQHLGVPKLLDPADIVDLAKPDERSIMTYVSLYYHVFSQSQQGELAGRRVAKLIDFTETNDKLKAEYNDRAKKLKDWIAAKDQEFASRSFPNSLEGVQGKMDDFKNYKKGEKPPKNDEKVSLESLYNALQTKLSVNHRPAFVPPAGLAPDDLNLAWGGLERGEHDYSLALLAEYRRQRKIKDLLRRFNQKVQKLEQWITEHEASLARRDDLGDTLAAVRAKLKNHESFEEEMKAMDARNASLKQIQQELKTLGYTEQAALDQQLATKDKNWEKLQATAAGRKEALLAELARQQQIEDALLAFAKRALAFRVWANEADDQLTDPISVDTQQEVKELQGELDAFLKENGVKQNEVQELNKLAEQLRGWGVTETTFSEVSLDQVNQKWNQVQKLVEQRRVALEEEAKRQGHHEELRLEFAQKAEAFAKVVAHHNERVRGLSGSPDAQIEELGRIHSDVKGSTDAYTELVALTQKMEEQAIADNSHTSHTIESLRASWNALAKLIKEKGTALDKEVAGTRKTNLTADQVREFKECFIYFDKDKDAALNRLELFSCLKSLGYDFPLDENGPLDRLLGQIGTDGKVNFEQFMTYMEKVNSDVDSPEQINEAFSTIAGGKDFVTEAQLRQVLPAEKVDYLVKQMPKSSSGDGYDYKAFTANAYNR